MKPAPFHYHAPKTIDEAVANAGRGAPRRRPRAGRRPEPGADHGVPPGAPRPPRRHQRRRRRCDGLPLTATGSPSAPASATRLSQAGGGRAARATAGHGRAPHRALSDPHARHVLRQRRACRPGVRMVRGRGDARRRNGGASRVGGTRSIPAQDFFQGIMTTALEEDEILAEVRLPILPPTPGSASTSSTAAPAISRSPWRW